MIDVKKLINIYSNSKRRTFFFLKERKGFKELKYSPSLYKQRGIKEYFVIIQQKDS